MSQPRPATREDLEQLLRQEGVAFSLFSMAPNITRIDIGTLADGTTPAFVLTQEPKKDRDVVLSHEFSGVIASIRIVRADEDARALNG